MSTNTQTALAEQPMPFNGALPVYNGEWTLEHAAHLFRRTTFGLQTDQIKTAVNDGMLATVNLLLADLELPAPPLSFDGLDAIANPGDDWTTLLYPRENRAQTRTSRLRSLFGWSMGQMLKREISVREKMTLFWHNHFAVERAKVADPKFLYQYITLLRENALGNFKTLVEKITINPAMLRYLDGRQNTKRKPNENYARELLELFALGKGPTVGEGDYTHYTEDDVLALAKILTGWRDIGYNSAEVAIPQAVYRPNDHDTSAKQLSHRFDNVVIENQGEEEYKALIDIIFQKEEPARFIVRKLYRWFVNFDITLEIETQIIEPLAQELITNNFEIKPTLHSLFTSQYFYDESVRGAVIKNPMEFIFSALNQLEVKMPEEQELWYRVLLSMHNYMARLDMQIFFPPNVAGWNAYYQEPMFYQSWISSVTLPERMKFTDRIADRGQSFQQYRLIIDSLSFIEKLDNPGEPNELISEMAKVLMPKPITENQHNVLKEILIPGLPDYEWTLEYVDYKENPDDENLKMSVQKQLNAVIQAMLSMPEFYLA